MAWDYPTNFSNGTEAVTGMASFFVYMNYATNDWFALGILLIIFIMGLVGFSFTAGFAKGLAVSSFITLIFATYFLRLTMVTPAVAYLLIILVIVGVLLSRSENNPSY